MLTFDYFCSFNLCGSIKPDELVNNSDEVITCDDCGGKMKKGISAPALVGFDKNGSSKSGLHGKN